MIAPRIACVTIAFSIVFSAQSPQCAAAQAEAPGDAAQWDAPDGRPEVRRAEALLDGLRSDVADSAVLFGVPSGDQRERVRRDAREALALTVRAAPLLEEAINALQRRDDFTTDEDLQALRSELAVEYLEYRLPFARARAALLLAALDPAHERADDLAVIAVESVLALDLRDPALESRRAVVLSVGGLLGGAIDDATAETVSELAFNHAQDVALVAPGTAVEAVLQRGQRMAKTDRLNGARDLLDRAARRQPFRDSDDTAVPAWRVLLADAEFRVNFDAAQSLNRRDADAAVQRAFEAYERLLRDESLPMDHASRRVIALRRAQEALSGFDAPAPIPPIVLLAECAEAGGDDGFESGAIARLQRRLEAPAGVDAWMLAELQWMLASQLLARADAAPDRALRDRRSAMELLARIGAQSETWVDSARATSTACELAIMLARTEHAGEAAATLRAAIERAPDADDVNRWRIALAAIVDSEDESALLLREVPISSPEGPRARVELMTIAKQSLDRSFGDDRQAPAESIVALREEVIRGLETTTLDETAARALSARADVLAIDALLALDRLAEAVDLAAGVADLPGAERWMAPIAARLHQQMVRAERAGDRRARQRVAEQLVAVCQLRAAALPAGERADRNTTVLAEALLGAGRADEAARVVDGLLARLGDRADLLRIAAETRFALGDDVNAMRMFRQVVAPLEQSGALTPDYWQSWSRMLQILARQNEAGDRSDRIRIEIARLRMIDESLGGEPSASRIEEVEQQVGPAGG